MKIKKILILILVCLLSLVVVGCEDSTTSTTTTTTTTKTTTLADTYVYPTISNSDEDAIEGLSYVTKAEAYKMIKGYGGITSFLEYVDSVLFSKYFAQGYTSADLTKYIEETAAGMLKEAGSQEEYEKLLLLAAGNKTDDYIKLQAVRYKEAYDYIKGELEDHFSDYFDYDAYEEYFNEYKYELFNVEADAIIVSYNSMSDYVEALNNLGYIIYNSNIYSINSYLNNQNVGKTDSEKIYAKDINERDYATIINSGDTPISPISSIEAQNIFVTLYNNNYKYRYEDGFSIDLNGYTYSFSTINNSGDITIGESATDIANRLFEMEKDTYTYLTTKSNTNIGYKYTVIYKVSDTVNPGTTDKFAKEYSNLTEDEMNKVKDSYIRKLVENNLDDLLVEIRAEKGFEIVERDYLYLYDSSATLPTESSNVIFTYTDGDNTVKKTCDDYYEYVSERNINYYVILASLAKYATDDNHALASYIDKSSSYTSEYEDVAEDYDNDEITATGLAFELFKNEGYSFSSKEDIIKYDIMKNSYIYSVILQDMINKYPSAYEIELQLIKEKYDLYFDFTAVTIDIKDDFYNDYNYEQSYHTESIVSSISSFIDSKIVDATLVGYSDKTDKEKYDILVDIVDDIKKELSKQGITVSVTTSSTKQSSSFTGTEELREHYYNLFNSSNKVTYGNIKTDENGIHYSITYREESKTAPKFNYTGSETTTFDNTEEEISLKQLFNALKYKVYSSILSKSKAEENGLTGYPEATPDALTVSAYVNGYINEYFTANAAYAIVADYLDTIDSNLGFEAYANALK